MQRNTGIPRGGVNEGGRAMPSGEYRHSLRLSQIQFIPRLHEDVTALRGPLRCGTSEPRMACEEERAAHF